MCSGHGESGQPARANAALLRPGLAGARRLVLVPEAAPRRAEPLDVLGREVDALLGEVRRRVEREEAPALVDRLGLDAELLELVRRELVRWGLRGGGVRVRRGAGAESERRCGRRCSGRVVGPRQGGSVSLRRAWLEDGLEGLPLVLPQRVDAAERAHLGKS